MPVYNGQPGTEDLGGALPPPQSKKAQISPVPGTYQAREAPAGEETSVDVQPVRSVRAVVGRNSTRRERKVEGSKVVKRVSCSIFSVFERSRLESCCSSKAKGVKN